MSSQFVVITRDTANVGESGRVFVTGPHFSENIYSSTAVRAKATVYSRSEAERLLAVGKWRWLNPRIEPAPKP